MGLGFCSNGFRVRFQGLDVGFNLEGSQVLKMFPIGIRAHRV